MVVEVVFGALEVLVDEPSERFDAPEPPDEHPANRHTNAQSPTTQRPRLTVTGLLETSPRFAMKHPGTPSTTGVPRTHDTKDTQVGSRYQLPRSSPLVIFACRGSSSNVERLPDLRLSPEAHPKVTGAALRGTATLPVVWDVR